MAPFPAAALIIELTGPKSIDFVVQVAGQTSAQEGQQRDNQKDEQSFYIVDWGEQIAEEYYRAVDKKYRADSKEIDNGEVLEWVWVASQ